MGRNRSRDCKDSGNVGAGRASFLPNALGESWDRSLQEMRLQGLLHLGREACVDSVVHEADAAVVVVLLLL
jgi:hypothetical protein